MGKGGKKKAGKKGLDFGTFFDSTKPADEGWHSGVSAMTLDGGDPEQLPSTSGAAGTEAMDTADVIPLDKARQRPGLKLPAAALKISKRGSRTTTQKARRRHKQEQALARAEKAATRVSSQIKRKQQAVRGLCKARKLGVAAPALYHVDLEHSCLYRAAVDGRPLQQLLKEGALDEPALNAAMAELARSVSVMHDGGFIHGSLTAAHIYLQDDNQQVVLVEFANSYNSTYPDDKAGDLFILEQALQDCSPAGL
eukprot:gene1512-1848_t